MKFLGHEIPSIRHIQKRIDEDLLANADQIHLSKSYLVFDYIRSSICYGCGVMDYFLYEFYHLNRHGKKQFMTVRDRVAFDHKHNTAEGVEMVKNKEKALLHFERFIQRDWCGQTFHNTPEAYEAFARKHARAIVKPIDAMGGSGVTIIDTQNCAGGGTNLYQYCKEHNLLVEELIPQCDELNRIYPGCINTIRVVTVDGKCIGAALRMGTGGSEIDNAHAGGIFAEVDKESGIIVSKAMNCRKREYVRHPDTNQIIPGFQIPHWQEVLDMVREANTLIPGVSLIGWDIAISTEGPTIVEVNHMPSLELIQAPYRHGARPFFT